MGRLQRQRRADADGSSTYRRTRGRRSSSRTVLPVAAVALACCALAPPARAGSYKVVACDAHSGQRGVSANRSWALSGSAGRRGISLCPSGRNPYRGIVTRITSPAGAGAFERAAFTAPPYTTITGLVWNGRAARNGCNWAAQLRAVPSQSRLIGFAPRENCDINSFTYGATLDLPVPPGTTQISQQVQCGSRRCPSGATFHTFGATVTVDDPYGPAGEITGGGLAGGRWVGGGQDLAFDLSDNTGIARADLTIDGERSNSRSFPCDYARSTPCSNRSSSFDYGTERLPDGSHTARLTSTDAAGNTGAVERTFYVDNHPPGPVKASVAGGEGWHRSDGFSISWPESKQAFAPIVRAHYRLCTPEGECAQGTRDGVGLAEIGDLHVDKAGDNTLEVWLEDEAGNESSSGARPMHLRLDPEAPSVVFLPRDPADPLTVIARATDDHSGIAGGEIEMRAVGAGAWHPLFTRLEGDLLVAGVDDERFGHGEYEFRVHAVDHAGNQAATQALADGSPATIVLPVRVPTKLRAGFPKKQSRRKLNRRGGKRRVVRRRVRVLAPRGRVRLRRTASIRGRLVNNDGQPIAGAVVAVLSRPALPAGEFTAASLLQTDASGRFAYRVRGIRSRVLRFEYAGSALIHSSRTEVAVRVPAVSSIRADRRLLLNGQRVTFSGRVRTRPVPRAGKLLEIQAYFRGRWRTISTTRTSKKGRWRFRYRFGATRGVVRYRFRARLPREGGYPFGTGRSRVLGVTVRGL